MNSSHDLRTQMVGHPLRRREMLKLAAGASVAALLAACGGSNATDTPKPAAATTAATAPAAATAKQQSHEHAHAQRNY